MRYNYKIASYKYYNNNYNIINNYNLALVKSNTLRYDTLFNLLKTNKTMSFKKNLHKHYNVKKTLALNYKRNRFFPNIHTLKGDNYITLSLGMFMKFFLKSKSFLRSKSMYLILSSFLRKILIFSKFKSLILTISKTPLFLKEILSSLNEPVISIYKNPFNEEYINEKSIINRFKFSFILFLNNVAFTKRKLKKKGRLKRKITKRIILSNRVVD